MSDVHVCYVCGNAARDFDGVALCNYCADVMTPGEARGKQAIADYLRSKYPHLPERNLA